MNFEIPQGVVVSMKKKTVNGINPSIGCSLSMMKRSDDDNSIDSNDDDDDDDDNDNDDGGSLHITVIISTAFSLLLRRLAPLIIYMQLLKSDDIHGCAEEMEV
ncbi:Serine/threonine-protein phosphatase 2A regulatory subunit psrA [Dirofilaria immitis]